MDLQGHSDQQRQAGLGRRPTGVGRRPTTNVLKRAEFGCSEENESYSGGYPELIFAVWSWWDWGEGPVVGRRPTTNLSNHAEFGCSEENESCSGGYPELIYSLMHVLACTHGFHLVTFACTHGPRSVTCPPQGLGFIGA